MRLCSRTLRSPTARPIGRRIRATVFRPPVHVGAPSPLCLSKRAVIPHRSRIQGAPTGTLFHGEQRREPTALGAIKTEWVRPATESRGPYSFDDARAVRSQSCAAAEARPDCPLHKGNRARPILLLRRRRCKASGLASLHVSGTGRPSRA